MEMNNGLDEELGLTEKKEGPRLVKEEAKDRRKPFYEWEVGGEAYRMKLTSGMICRLEEKYKTNLLNLITAGDIPRLSVMLTVAQAALLPWKHGVKYEDVQKLFDRYVEEGGDQLSFYTTVIMGTMAVSGFFTRAQAEEISKKTEEMDMKI